MAKSLNTFVRSLSEAITRRGTRGYQIWIHCTDNGISCWTVRDYRTALRQYEKHRRFPDVHEIQVRHNRTGRVMLPTPFIAAIPTKWSHLMDRMGQSFIAPYKGQMRRYFPLHGRSLDEVATEAYFIVFGQDPRDSFEVGTAIMNTGLLDKVQKINGKRYMRTIVLI